MFTVWSFAGLQHCTCFQILSQVCNFLAVWRQDSSKLVDKGREGLFQEKSVHLMQGKIKTFLFLRKRQNFTLISSPGDWCGFPSPAVFSLKYQFLSGSPTIPFEDDDYCPPEFHTLPVINSSRVTWWDFRPWSPIVWMQTHPAFLQTVKRTQPTNHTQKVFDSFAGKEVKKVKFEEDRSRLLLLEHTFWQCPCATSGSEGTSADRAASRPETSSHSYLWKNAWEAASRQRQGTALLAAVKTWRTGLKGSDGAIILTKINSWPLKEALHTLCYRSHRYLLLLKMIFFF